MRTQEKAAGRKALGGLKYYCVFWLFLGAVFSAVIFMQVSELKKLGAEDAALGRQLAESQAKERELRQRVNFNKSGEFIEKYAHDELGLVYSNEVIIYNDSYTRER